MSSQMLPLGSSLRDVDPAIADAIAHEADRQEEILDMVASENLTAVAVMEAQGSILTNRYAQGPVGRRSYPECEHIDAIESLAVERARLLFGADYANLQPHSGVQANVIALMALLNPGDAVLGLAPGHGGHPTHGAPGSFAGRYFRPISYHVRRSDGRVDMDEVRALARSHRPKVVIAGWSAYPRHLDFEGFRAICDDVGAYLLVDMAHFAGLVAAGLHPSPVPYADVVTTTTHKTLAGPRGGLLLATRALADRLDDALSPGGQGGPLAHVVAAKAVALRIAMSPAFADQQRRTVEGARLIAHRLLTSAGTTGASVATGGTDVHLLIADFQGSALDAPAAQQRLLDVGVSTTIRQVPFDRRMPAGTSGVRIGSAVLAARGFSADDFTILADTIVEALHPDLDERHLPHLRARLSRLAAAHPAYPGREGVDLSGPVGRLTVHSADDDQHRLPMEKSCYRS